MAVNGRKCKWISVYPQNNLAHKGLIYVSRDTMLQALRGCISGAGNKMSDIIRRQVTSSLEGYLSTNEDSTRTTAAACLGTICKSLKEEELNTVLSKQLLGRWFSPIKSQIISSTLIRYKDVILSLSVQEIPLWKYDGHKIVLSPQWCFLYW